jgi:hypothetical protein
MEQNMSDKQMHRKEETYWWVEDYKIPANLAFIFCNKFPSGYSVKFMQMEGSHKVKDIPFSAKVLLALYFATAGVLLPCSL